MNTHLPSKSYLAATSYQVSEGFVPSIYLLTQQSGMNDIGLVLINYNQTHQAADIAQQQAITHYSQIKTLLSQSNKKRINYTRVVERLMQQGYSLVPNYVLNISHATMQ